MVETQRYRDARKFLHLDTTTSGVFSLRNGVARLHGVTVGTTGGTLRVFNGPTVAGQAIAIITPSLPLSFDFFDLPLASGLTIEKTVNAGDYTIIYE